MRLSAAIGRERAARLLLTGDPIDAVEAGRIGLVGELADDAEATARVIATRIAANAPQAVAALKRSLDEPDAARTDARFDTLFAQAAFAEGIAAQRERRPPQF
jgi:enoyl-CoA hydratase/carnithine racemase